MVKTIEVTITKGEEVKIITFPDTEKGNKQCLNYLEDLAKKQRSLSDVGEQYNNVKKNVLKYSNWREKDSLYSKYRGKMNSLGYKVARTKFPPLRVKIEVK